MLSPCNVARTRRALQDLEERKKHVQDSAPGFNRQPAVINGFTDLILEVFGAEVGAHARSAVGLAELPFNIPVEVEGEVELHPCHA
jgi:enamine deaminase RidA (YjgF/YER057c/UK114 family)